MAVSGCAPLYRGMVLQFDGREMPPLSAGLAPSPPAASSLAPTPSASGLPPIGGCVGGAMGGGAAGSGAPTHVQRDDSMSGGGGEAADGGGDVIVPGGARLTSATAASTAGGDEGGGEGGPVTAVPCRVIGIAKLKCLCYLQRTFGVRNMLPLLVDKGPAAYLEGVGRFYRNWQVPPEHQERLTPLLTAWAMEVQLLSPQERQTLRGGSYLEFLEPFLDGTYAQPPRPNRSIGLLIRQPSAHLFPPRCE